MRMMMMMTMVDDLSTISLHPHKLALLVPTVLATVPLSFVDDAVATFTAGVTQTLPHRPLEKSLAAFAAENVYCVHTYVCKYRWR